MAINRFVVFDVETPNRYNNRISAIGISVVENGRIVQDYFSLVDPEQPFDWFNSMLTGINEETVFDAPAFPEVWELSMRLSAHLRQTPLACIRKRLFFGI